MKQTGEDSLDLEQIEKDEDIVEHAAPTASFDSTQ